MAVRRRRNALIKHVRAQRDQSDGHTTYNVCMPEMVPERGGMLRALKKRARILKLDTYVLYLAVRDPRTPWYAKAVAAAVVV